MTIIRIALVDTPLNLYACIDFNKYAAAKGISAKATPTELNDRGIEKIGTVPHHQQCGLQIEFKGAVNLIELGKVLEQYNPVIY